MIRRAMRWLPATLAGMVWAGVIMWVDAGAASFEHASGNSAIEKESILKSRLAGSWYSADPRVLREEIAGFLRSATGPILEEVQALILPHAGYRYSGPTAAYGIRQIQGKHYSRVVVMGPSHRVFLENTCSVPDVAFYETPLGRVPLDTDFIERLRSYSMVVSVPEVHQGEHSVQIEVPLLQYVLGEFKLIPIVIGNLDQENTRRLARIVGGLIDPDTLVVASSDFTHYGPNYRYVPFDTDIPSKIKELDLGACREIEKKDSKGFRSYCDRTGATICGRNPIAVLLAMLPSAATAHLLHHDTSGRITGDFTNSVSYLSIAFTGRWPRRAPPESHKKASSLTPDEKKRLLSIARKTLESVFRTGEAPDPDALGVEITEEMKQVAGTFVTLKKGSNLRGCIGEIFPQRPVYRSVSRNAVNAAFRDPRFLPLRADELDDVEIEISVLTPPRSVSSTDEIVIGKHGIVLMKGHRQAVFLPQVAPEQGWGLEETLSHLSRKAGLEPDAWKKGARFQVFEADVFHEPPEGDKEGT